MIDVVTDLERRGIGFVSLTEALDTTSPDGRLLFHLMGALARLRWEVDTAHPHRATGSSAPTVAAQIDLTQKLPGCSRTLGRAEMAKETGRISLRRHEVRSRPLQSSAI